jgi:hypothetical protein
MAIRKPLKQKKDEHPKLRRTLSKSTNHEQVSILRHLQMRMTDIGHSEMATGLAVELAQMN